MNVLTQRVDNPVRRHTVLPCQPFCGTPPSTFGRCVNRDGEGMSASSPAAALTAAFPGAVRRRPSAGAPGRADLDAQVQSWLTAAIPM